jgi:two-component sensor histidine kinase
VLVNSTPRTGPADKPTGCWLICHDICALHQALDEKELLLKEVHHRVKNNLQIISSLINMQRDVATSEEARIPLAESARRVRAMALIHQHLYSGRSMAKVDFADYAKELTSQLQALLSPSAKLHWVGRRVDLPIDTAVPCGLILNELVTNALKYGLSSDGSCRIHVHVESDNGNLLFSVKDHGPGLPDGVELGTAKSLGFELIRALTRQIRGEFEFCDAETSSFRVRVPLGSLEAKPQRDQSHP